MDPFTIMMLASTAVSAGGQLLAGKQAKDAAQMNAFSMETENIINQAMARQQANARREEYDLATSANIAAFSAMGRDVGSDRSVAAFLERQKEIVARDTSRIDQQSEFERLGSKFAQSNERMRGKQAATASLFSAVGTLAEGGFRYYQVKT